MKLDELEKMAKQTAAYGVHPSGEFIYSFYTEQLQAFAKLVAEHEREACAEICEDIGSKDYTFYREESSSSHCAEAIRARGQA
jgi:hypothetical protein